MLDYDLAELYGYEVKALNQQVKKIMIKQRSFLKLNSRKGDRVISFDRRRSGPGGYFSVLLLRPSE